MEENEEIIQKIYESSLEDEIWKDAIKDMSNKIFKSAIGFSHKTLTGGISPLLIQERLDPYYDNKLFNTIGNLNEHIGIRALRQASVGKSFNIASIYDSETIKSDASIKTVLDPQGFDKAILVRLSENDGAETFISIIGSKDAPDFSRDDLSTLNRYGKHISRALKLRDIRINSSTYDSIRKNYNIRSGRGLAIIQVNREARFINADDAGGYLLNEGSILKLLHGRIHISSNKSGINNEQFWSRVRICEWNDTPLYIQTEDNRLAKISIIPLNVPLIYTKNHLIDSRIASILVDYEAESKCKSVEILSDIFKLTTAEKRVLDALDNIQKLNRSCQKAFHLSQYNETAHLHHISKNKY